MRLFTVRRETGGLQSVVDAHVSEVVAGATPFLPLPAAGDSMSDPVDAQRWPWIERSETGVARVGNPYPCTTR